MMGNKPLRQRRMDYVRSDAIETSQGTVYHVELKPKPDEPPISILELATQRDFTIGISLASLAIITLVGLTSGVSLLASIAIVGTGATLGALSDYTRNKKELEEGVYIGKPSNFNRDMVKSALSWGFIGKLAVMASSILVAAFGIDVPGGEVLQQAWEGAESSGVFSQAAAVMRAVPPSIDAISFGATATYGAVKGAHHGYHRMEKEYHKAQTKHRNPEIAVDAALEQSMTPIEALLNVAAPALSGGIASEVINAASASKTELDGKKEHVQSEAEHLNSFERSFVKAEELRREKAANAEMAQGI
jgi:hypothetical protein